MSAPQPAQGAPGQPASSKKDGMDQLISQLGAAMPPSMVDAKQYSTDEVLTMINRTPLFMTELDETDGQGGENMELEAFKALAYEGTRAEIAQNFREQGNEQAKMKRWPDAKKYYDLAIKAVRDEPEKDQAEGEEKKGVEVEAKERRKIEELCLVNRALCNLELKNYRACNLDCAATLRMDSTNVKAFYRSAQACYALDKLDAAYDACVRGLVVDANNTSIQTLLTKIENRKKHLLDMESKRQQRFQAVAIKKAALQAAIRARGISVKETKGGEKPDLEDAVMKLENETDPTSALSVPLMILYPLTAQSDFIKSVSETETLAQHLEYILPPPWDEGTKEYAQEAVECYCETAAGGLSKIGKKISVGKILGGGKIQIVDGLLNVNVLPKARAAEWIEMWKERKGK